MMETQKYNVGDKMRVVGIQHNNEKILNWIGTIITIYLPGSWTDCGVEFEERFDSGHNCGGEGKAGHCYNFDWHNIELYKEKIPDLSISFDELMEIK